MAEIINNQRKLKLDRRIYRTFTEHALRHIEEADHRTVTVAFVSDRRMRALNREFRGKDKTTDVLSFPFEADEFEPGQNFLGDIVISPEQARKQAAENGLDIETEIKQLILHGILHLCGYDHETDDGRMNRRELEARERLGI